MRQGSAEQLQAMKHGLEHAPWMCRAAASDETWLRACATDAPARCKPKNSAKSQLSTVL